MPLPRRVSVRPAATQREYAVLRVPLMRLRLSVAQAITGERDFAWARRIIALKHLR